MNALRTHQPALEPVAREATGHRLRLLSYNVQVGIASSSPHHYLTNMWKHLLPAACRQRNLERIAQFLSGYDVVALQELDAGSHRTRYINQTEYLATQAGFPFWYHQCNRDLGRVAKHGNGLLSRVRPTEIIEHKLPGPIPGRGGLFARYGNDDNPLIVVLMHLALGKRARQRQLDYITEVISEYEHAVVMGDLNCSPDSPEMASMFRRTRLVEPVDVYHTYPSWRPQRNIDHILVTPSLRVTDYQVLTHAYSDHLPISMEIALPESMVPF